MMNPLYSSTLRSKSYALLGLRKSYFIPSTTISAATTTTPCSFSSSPDTPPTTPLVGWQIDTDTKVGFITLQAPKSFNALTVEMGKEFFDTVMHIRHELTDGKVNVNAIVLQGEGDQAFSAGGNVEWLKSLRHNSTPQNEEIMLNFYKSFHSVRKLPVPVVVALQGPAIGAGCCLALACDLRVAAPKSRILGFTFSKLGIHTGMGGSHLLQQALPQTALCNELLLTGKILGGEEALKLGLVNRVAEDAKAEARKLAEEIAKQNPVAIRTMIETLRYQQDQGLDEALRMEAKAQAICYSRDDWGEGVDAAIEKRDPVFDDFHKAS